MTETITTPADKPNAVQRVAFYFSAHEDDWQLFMNPAAFRDVLDGAKTVFIHMTAGDGGLGTGTSGRKHAYYLAREHGAEAAIHFMADAGDYPAPADPASAQATFNGHPIYRTGYRKTVAYFLRLPDGNPEGTGYLDTGYQSLKRLAEGQISALTAIDGSTTYRGWRDLVATLRAIIDGERGDVHSVQLHMPELDLTRNPNDHSDHVMTAKATRDAAAGLDIAQVLHHIGYASGEQPENLSGFERDMKCAVYAVTLAAVQALGHSTAWQHYDQAFIARNYCRIEQGGKGTNTG
jgi:LmbE family N-acetylglucosaminyl deacetylase